MKAASTAPPAYLDDRAVEIFTETLAQLGEEPTVTDIHTLGTYAQSLSDYERLTLRIREDGDMGTDKNEADRKHPLGIPQAKAFDMWSKAAATLMLDRKSKGVKPTKEAKGRSLRKPARQIKAV